MLWCDIGEGVMLWCAVVCCAVLQVFEALRSQSDYEQFLGSLSAVTGDLNAAKLPPLWVRGIAAQMRSSDRVGRCAWQGVGVQHTLA
jgi:hypothetical protein